MFREVTEGKPHQTHFFATVWMSTLEPKSYSHLSVAMNLAKHILCVRAPARVCPLNDHFGSDTSPVANILQNVINPSVFASSLPSTLVHVYLLVPTRTA